MNILVISTDGMYKNYTYSYVHNQNKAFTRLGHHVRTIIPVAYGKRSNSGKRFWPLIERKTQDNVELCFVRYISLSSWGVKRFNHISARFVVKLLYKKLLQGFQPDVIHANGVDHCGFIGAGLKGKCSVPLVITALGGDVNAPLERGDGARLKEICQQADMLVSISPALDKKYEIIGATKPKECISCGFEAQNVQELPKKPHSVIQVGNLTPSKHNDYTIRAVARLKETYPDITLTIVGDGPEQSRLEALCEELGITESVRFLGRLPNADTMAEMAKSQFFVMPSYPEGQGIANLEAMASGCVTVGTKGEGIDGVIVSGENGFLVPRDDIDGIVDVLDRCFQDQELMQRIAAAGRTRVKSLTWLDNAKSYERFLIDLIKQ